MPFKLSISVLFHWRKLIKVRSLTCRLFPPNESVMPMIFLWLIALVSPLIHELIKISWYEMCVTLHNRCVSLTSSAWLCAKCFLSPPFERCIENALLRYFHHFITLINSMKSHKSSGALFFQPFSSSSVTPPSHSFVGSFSFYILFIYFLSMLNLLWK